MNIAFNAPEHWEKIYQAKQSTTVSWYQEKPTTSLRLIAKTGLDENTKIIDIGGGDSTLVDALLGQGFKDITILDVSPTSLQKAKGRLGDKAVAVTWLAVDLRELETAERYDLWHDRAVLHFLTAEGDIKKYVQVVRRFVKPKGYIIIAAFSVNGPTRCSGLNVQQYSEESMRKLFAGADFEHIISFEEEHLTPWQARQNFIYSLFRRCSERAGVNDNE